MGELTRESQREDVVTLAFWECGYVEVDVGKTHPCDGRDVCSATYHRYVSLAAVHEALELRSADCIDLRFGTDA